MNAADLAELRLLVCGLRSSLEAFTFASTWRRRPFNDDLSSALDAVIILQERLDEIDRDDRRAA